MDSLKDTNQNRDRGESRRADMYRVWLLAFLGMVLMASLFELGRWLSF